MQKAVPLHMLLEKDSFKKEAKDILIWSLFVIDNNSCTGRGYRVPKKKIQDLQETEQVAVAYCI